VRHHRPRQIGCRPTQKAAQLNSPFHELALSDARCFGLGTVACRIHFGGEAVKTVPRRIALKRRDPVGNVCDPTASSQGFPTLLVRRSARLVWQEPRPMSRTEHDRVVIIERIERVLVVLAYFIELDGDVHVPMYEKFEAELAELRKREDTKARARKLLLSYANAGGLKAIC
jgi:hypothetical protein